MTGNVSRVFRMRTVALPFTDTFSRSVLEDTDHPWYSRVGSDGLRYEIVSNRMAIPARTLGYSFLKLPRTTFDVTFTFALGNGTNGSAGDLQIAMFDYDPTEDPSNAPNRYLFAVGTSVDGYTLYRNPPSFVFFSGGGALTRGSSYTGRLVYDGTTIKLYIGGVLKASETAYFTPSSRQCVLRFISDDESNWFDDITIAMPTVNLLTAQQWSVEDGTTTGFGNLSAFVSLSSDTTYATLGTHSLMYSPTAAANGSWTTVPTVPALPGTPYNVSVKARRFFGSSHYTLGMIWYDSSGVEISRDQSLPLGSSSSGVFEDGFFVATSPAGTASMRVLMDTRSVGSVFANMWFDQLGLYASSTAAPIFIAP